MLTFNETLGSCYLWQDVDHCDNSQDTCCSHAQLTSRWSQHDHKLKVYGVVGQSPLSIRSTHEPTARMLRHGVVKATQRAKTSQEHPPCLSLHLVDPHTVRVILLREARDSDEATPELRGAQFVAQEYAMKSTI